MRGFHFTFAAVAGGLTLAMPPQSQAFFPADFHEENIAEGNCSQGSNEWTHQRSNASRRRHPVAGIPPSHRDAHPARGKHSTAVRLAARSQDLKRADGKAGIVVREAASYTPGVCPLARPLWRENVE